MTTPAPMPEDPDGQPMDDPVHGPSFWLEQAQRYGEIERNPESEAVLRKGLALFPQDAYLHAYLSWALYRLRRYQESSLEAATALSIDRDSDLAHYVLALVAIVNGKRNAAIEMANNGLRRNPDNANLSIAKGLALYELGRYEAAACEFQSVLAKNTTSLFGRFHLGKSRLAMGDYRSSSQVAQELARLYPNESLTHELMGRLAYETGRAREAIKHYKECLRISPHDTEVQQLLAIAESASGFLTRPLYLYVVFCQHHKTLVLISLIVFLIIIAIF